jgi:Icc-related predicted phosphoesterase
VNIDADTLVIAGDISNNVIDTANFLEAAKKHYKNVAFVDGNHDHYNEVSVSENQNYLFNNAMLDDWTFLPFRDLIIDDTVFIGNNSWYDWNAGDARYNKLDYKNAWHRNMADSRVIKFDPNCGPDILAERQAKRLFDKVTQYNADTKINNIVIVTHSLPLKEALIVKREVTPYDVQWNLLGGSFVNTQLETVWQNNAKGKIRVWTFGHTHSSHNIQKNGVDFVCHPKGYPGEANAFNYQFKTITIN